MCPSEVEPGPHARQVTLFPGILVGRFISSGSRAISGGYLAPGVEPAPRGRRRYYRYATVLQTGSISRHDSPFG